MDKVKVGVLGVGKTKHGVQLDVSLRDLLVYAGQVALDDAGITPDMVGLVIIGNVCSVGLNNENTVGPMIADHLNISRHAGAASCESACATGVWASHIGVVAILSGLYDYVLVMGGEKMNDVVTDISTGYIAAAADVKEEYFTGLTFPSGVALTARKYMLEYGCSELELLGHTSSKNHYYGARNPHAHLRFEATPEECLKSPMIADPLRLFDVCPMTDAAAAMVMCRPEIMAESGKDPVYITGSAVATGGYYATTDTLYDAYAYIKRPCDKVYAQAGLGPNDIHVAEVYNAFSIQESLGVESVGWAEMGQGWKLAVEGTTWHEGKWPTNLSGGLLSKGHPLGATGLTQLIDLAEQLRGTFKGVLAPNNPTNALAVCRGGPGASSGAHILQKL